MIDSNLAKKPKIAIIGGTGREGRGLAYRFARAGYEVVIGSRSLEKADTTVVELQSIIGRSARISGSSIIQAAEGSDVVVLSVPYQAHAETCELIKPLVTGKLIIDVVVPLNPPKVSRVKMPAAGSAAQEAVNLLGPDVRVCTAFQNISFDALLSDEDIECDVLVCGTDKNSRLMTIELVKAAGMNAWDAGPVDNSVVVEGLTSILIGLNQQFGVHSAGIKITGIPK